MKSTSRMNRRQFVGAAAAAFLYDFLANPRLVARPIMEAVTHDDSAARAVAQ